MIFKVMPKGELERLFRILSQDRTAGPVRCGESPEGRELFAFEYVTDFSRLRIDYDTTTISPKPFFLPTEDTIASFDMDESGGWEKTVDTSVEGRVVLFGLHACDINALNRLDKVLMNGRYAAPRYTARRQNMFIVGIDCTPRPHCFCRSMGTDTALHGFDMFITDIGRHYFIEILSAEAYQVVEKVRARDPKEQHHEAFMAKAEKHGTLFSSAVDTTDLTKILDMEFQSPVWESWGRMCLSCGSCASVCPTCYCYGVENTVDLDLKGAKKVMHLYSCNIIDFAEVAGGHNFRPDSPSRLKYRYYHKHRGFVEAYEEPLCVGCGRCGLTCLAEITVPEVIASVRKGKVRHG